MWRVWVRCIMVCWLTAANAQTNLQWRSYYAGRTNYYIIPRSLHVDDNGNVYVAADSCALSQQNNSVVIVKYSNTGLLLWSFESLGFYCQSAVMDSAANIYFAATLRVGSADAFVVKLESTGIPLWTNHIVIGRGDYYPTVKMAVDGIGNIYLAATTDYSGGHYIIFAKWNTNGDLQWTGQSAIDDSSLRALAVDRASGAMYFSAGRGFHKVVNGIVEWVRYYSSELGGLSHDIRTTICVSQDAGIYFAGVSEGRPALWKLDSSGTLVWFRRYAGPLPHLGLGHPGSQAAVVDSFGNVTVAADSVVVHFDRMGVQEWSAQIAGMDPIYGPALSLDENHTPYLRAAVTSSNLLLTRFEPNGSRRWQQWTPSIGANWPLLIVTNASCISVETAKGPSGTSDLVTSKYSTSVGASGPLITGISQSRTVFAGTIFDLSVTASGNAPIQYRWFFGENPIPGATNALLSIIASTTNAGTYWVEVTDSQGTTASPEVNLGVLVAEDMQADAGDTATFTVQASGIVLDNVRWRFGGFLVATGATFTVSNVMHANAGLYQVEVDDPFGATVSNAVHLFVREGVRAEWIKPLFNWGDPGFKLALVKQRDIAACSTGYGFALHVFTPDGVMTNTFATLGANQYTADVAADANGRVYVGISGWWEFITRQYDLDSGGFWQRSESLLNIRYPTFSAMAVDDVGRSFVFACGASSFITPFTSIAAIRQDESNSVDIFRLELAGLYQFGAFDIALISNDDVCLLWAWRGDQNTNIISRYSRDGALRWTRNFFTTDGLILTDLMVDPFGNLFVTGATQYGYAVTKWSTEGELLWLRRFHSSSTNDTYAALDAELDPSGNLLVTGRAGTVKYSQNGDLLWATPVRGVGVKTDEKNNVYVAGRATKPHSMPEAFVAKLSPAGMMKWMAVHKARTFDYVTDIAVPQDGVVYASLSEAETNSSGSYTYYPLLIKYVEATAAPGNVLLSPPTPRPAALGSPVTLQMALASPDSHRLQWLFDGTPLPDATNAILNLPSVQTDQFGGYALHVSTETNEMITPEIWLCPQVAISEPHYDSSTRQAGFTFPTDVRYAYTVQSSQNLTQWLDRAEIASSNGPVRFEQTCTNSSEFYRVLIRR